MTTNANMLNALDTARTLGKSTDPELRELAALIEASALDVASVAREGRCVACLFELPGVIEGVQEHLAELSDEEVAEQAMLCPECSDGQRPWVAWVKFEQEGGTQQW